MVLSLLRNVKMCSLCGGIAHKISSWDDIPNGYYFVFLMFRFPYFFLPGRGRVAWHKGLGPDVHLGDLKESPIFRIEPGLAMPMMTIWRVNYQWEILSLSVTQTLRANKSKNKEKENWNNHVIQNSHIPNRYENQSVKETKAQPCLL